MARKARTHETRTHIGKTALTELNAGANITLKVRVSCSDFCDLQGESVRIVDQDAAIQEIELVEFDGVENGADIVVVNLPDKPGSYTWTAMFPAQEKEGILHQESSALFSFVFKPHTISIAVWDVPSPIVTNTKYRIRVGVKCSANCELVSKEIEVYDHEGSRVGTGTLGDVPWSATSAALYWAEVELEAPGTEGYYRWTVKSPKPDLGLPHEETSHTFGFRTRKPPEHVVTVEVIEEDTKTPIKNAYVLLPPYSSYSDERGVATIEASKGNYELHVSKKKYETRQMTVNVASDIAIKAELLVPPPDLLEDS